MQLCSSGVRNVDGVEGERVTLTVLADQSPRLVHGQARVALTVLACPLRRRLFT